jgi:hypothetical protein
VHLGRRQLSGDCAHLLVYIVLTHTLGERTELAFNIGSVLALQRRRPNLLVARAVAGGTRRYAAPRISGKHEANGGIALPQTMPGLRKPVVILGIRIGAVLQKDRGGFHEARFGRMVKSRRPPTVFVLAYLTSVIRMRAMTAERGDKLGPVLRTGFPVCTMPRSTSSIEFSKSSARAAVASLAKKTASDDEGGMPPSVVVARIAKQLGSGRSSLPGRRRISKRESRTVVLRRDSEQAHEAAAHRFLRAEAATLGDTLDRRA